MMVLVVFPVFPVFWEILHNPNAHSQQSTSLPAILSDTIVTNHQGTVWSPPLIQRPAPALCWSLGPPTPRPPLVALRAAVATVSEGHRVSIGCESVTVQTPARHAARSQPPTRQRRPDRSGRGSPWDWTGNLQRGHCVRVRARVRRAGIQAERRCNGGLRWNLPAETRAG